MPKSNKKNRRAKHRHVLGLEKLESRQYYSVVAVTPQTVGIVAHSPAGSTFDFSPGTYKLPPNSNPNNPAATWPSGTYVGDGAIITTTDTSSNGTPQLVQFGAGSDVSGFTFETGQIIVSNGTFNIHDNTFTDGWRGIFVLGSSGHIDHNTFTHLSSEGVYGYPSSNGTYDDNTFDYVQEPIHLVAAANNLDVSGNVITHLSRCGIELQNAMTNLTVNNNYIGDWLATGMYLDISCATGGGSNITIEGNTLLHTSGNGVNYTNSGGAIEIAGSDVTIKNNLSWGFLGLVLDGMQGANTVSNNTVYGGNRQDWGYDGFANQVPVNDSDAPPRSLSALNPPLPPTAGSSTPVSSTSPAPVVTTPAPAPLPAVPAGITATVNGQSGQVAVTAPAGAAIAIYPSTLDPSTAVNLGKISGTSTVIGGIPLDWQVTVTVTTGGTTYTLPSVQILNSDVPMASAFNPALVQAVIPPVVTAPTPVTAPVAPAAPTSFAATSPSSSEVDLSWTDNTSGSATYLLQRRATHGSDGFETIATLAAGTTSYKDTAVNADWEYDYQLTAVVNGVSSSVAAVHVQAQAAPVIPPVVSTPVVIPPVVVPPVVTPVTAAATNFAAVSPSSSEIDLSWTDNTSDTGTYVLQRRATNGALGFQTVATLAAGTTSYNDTAVNADWEYDYQLTAVVNGVSSSIAAVHVQAQAAPAVSAPVVVPPVVIPPVATPPVVVPPVVTPVTAAATNFVAVSPSSSEIVLSWTDNTSDTGTYVLQRRATNGSHGFQTVATLAAGTTSYNDTAVNADWEYDYQLRAVVNGVSSSVAAVHVQVQAAPVVSAPVVPPAVRAPAVVPPVATPVVAPPVVSAPVTAVTAAATNFVASSSGGSEVDLSWTDNTNGAAAYVVQRRTTRGRAGFQNIATLAAGATSYSDQRVTPYAKYQYRLIAVISGVSSQPAQTQVQAGRGAGQSVGSVAGEPAGPAVLLASPGAAGVELSWVDTNAGTATYVVGRRATYGSSQYRIIARLPAGATSFKDPTAQATWEYDYYVQAVAPSGAASVAATVRVRAVEPAIQWLLANAA